jgi:hypothetical protein
MERGRCARHRIAPPGDHLIFYAKVEVPTAPYSGLDGTVVVTTLRKMRFGAPLPDPLERTRVSPRRTRLYGRRTGDEIT